MGISLLITSLTLYEALAPLVMADRHSRSSIIYQSLHGDVVLVDIPTSIATAQDRSDTLLSTPPLEAPIEIPDYRPPRTNKAEAKSAQYAPDFFHHEEYKALIEQALAEIHSHVPGSWCAERKLLTQHANEDGSPEMKDHDPQEELDSRLRQWSAWTKGKGGDATSDLQRMMASLGATSEYDAPTVPAVTQTWVMSYVPARESTNCVNPTEDVPMGEEPSDPWTSTLHNPEDYPLKLTISETRSGCSLQEPEYRFTIPPRSTLFLSDSTHSDAFRTSFRQLTDDYNLPRHFDLVLLDPPWPNRSAKRKGGYEQIGGMPYMKRMLLKMDIDTYLEHNALVGVWITNKASVRKHVLGPGGLFERWNVGLVEEWLWIKTTTRGEPMFNIDDDLRKPYEILLLGRAAPNSWTTMEHSPSIKRRVIAAVPDIHSRKPCLKELLTPYMPDAKDYSALEVFSRYLVSGWTSWGNEVLKFNCDEYWAAD